MFSIDDDRGPLRRAAAYVKLVEAKAGRVFQEVRHQPVGAARSVVNWLDYFIIALLIAGAVAGMKAGLIGAAFMAVGAFVGWVVAGQLSDDVSGLFGWPLSNEGLVSVILYVALIAAAIVAARYAIKIVRPILSVVTLGTATAVDRGGGAALGLVVGLAVSGAVILMMARFSYDFDPPSEGVAGTIVRFVPFVDDTKNGVESALTASKVVPVFISVTKVLPANAFGFVPTDFRTSLDSLDRNLGSLRADPDGRPAHAAAS